MIEKKRRKFAHEILGLIGISAAVALVLFLIVSNIAAGVAQEYCFQNDVPMTEFDWIALDRWIFGGSTVVSILCFSVLFLALLGDRLVYIRKITRGIDNLHTEQPEQAIPLEGNNELTELADAINHMAQARQQIREKEQALAREKEQLIRDLSHDIRTPLTSIQAYSQYLSDREQITDAEKKTYIALIEKKAQQIRELTDVLLEGSKRQSERFENIAFLMAQIVAEFEAELEERFQIQADLAGCAAMAGALDVQEVRRIFDNLCSNIQKYADPTQPVRLSIHTQGRQLVIRQSNAILQAAGQAESYGIGLGSIRRIAQHYEGTVQIQQDDRQFAIEITLCNL